MSAGRCSTAAAHRASALAVRRVRPSRLAGRWLDRAVGALFVSFGLKLALPRRAD